MVLETFNNTYGRSKHTREVQRKETAGRKSPPSARPVVPSKRSRESTKGLRGDPKRDDVETKKSLVKHTGPRHQLGETHSTYHLSRLLRTQPTAGIWWKRR